jgi:hypothetical protein
VQALVYVHSQCNRFAYNKMTRTQLWIDIVQLVQAFKASYAGGHADWDTLDRCIQVLKEIRAASAPSAQALKADTVQWKRLTTLER